MPAESAENNIAPSSAVIISPTRTTTTPSRTLWIVRHGQRADNVDPRWRADGAVPRGQWDDPPLSPRGLDQAHAVGLALRSAPLHAVFCSPFTRCLQTAQHILRARYGSAPMPKMCIEPGLCESLNACQTPPGFPAMDEIRNSFPNLPINWDYLPFYGSAQLAAASAAESTDFCCFRRVIGTLRHLLEKMQPIGNVLIVSHGTPISACHFALSGGELNYPGQCTISEYRIRMMMMEGKNGEGDDGWKWRMRKKNEEEEEDEGKKMIPWKMGKSVIILEGKKNQNDEAEDYDARDEGRKDEERKRKKMERNELSAALDRIGAVASERNPFAGMVQCVSWAGAAHLPSGEDLHDRMKLYG